MEKLSSATKDYFFGKKISYKDRIKIARENEERSIRELVASAKKKGIDRCRKCSIVISGEYEYMRGEKDKTLCYSCDDKFSNI